LDDDAPPEVTAPFGCGIQIEPAAYDAEEGRVIKSLLRMS
jgi:hypothetical protein